MIKVCQRRQADVVQSVGEERFHTSNRSSLAIPPSGKRTGFSDRFIVGCGIVCDEISLTPFRWNGIEQLIHMDVNTIIVKDSKPLEHAHTEVAGLIWVIAAIQAILHCSDRLYF